MNAYIKLKTSEDTEYYFRVVHVRDSYRPIRRKIGKFQNTVTGKVDYQVGPLNLEWRYILKVYATDPDGGSYGTLANLKTLFDLNDPDGTPTNVLTLTDHYESTHSVYIVGDLIEEPMTPSLSDGWFKVPIHLVKTEAQA